jgi:epoxyqueuosine reductase
VTDGCTSIETLLKAQAYGLGFDLAGIATLGPASTAPEFERWLERGFAGDMSYLERGREKRRDTRLPYSGARSAIVVALNYGGTQASGSVARYARGRDYHDVIEKKLRALHRWLESAAGRTISGKPYVDTGPILERDLARRAGLGWFGKNSNLINPNIGSFFFIGALLVDMELQNDAPFEAERCGTCTRCMDACPTDAIVEAGVVDANRCISYLTIENRKEIPGSLRTAVGQLIYGCDICQDVCPWNVRFARDLTERELEPRAAVVDSDPAQLLLLSAGEFSSLFAKSPIRRTRRTGLARNSAVALGNRRAPGDRDALLAALETEEDSVVREHCEWALAQFDEP